MELFKELWFSGNEKLDYYYTFEFKISELKIEFGSSSYTFKNTKYLEFPALMDDLSPGLFLKLIIIRIIDKEKNTAQIYRLK